MKRAWKTVTESEQIFLAAFDLTEDRPTLIEQKYTQLTWEGTVVHIEKAEIQELPVKDCKY